MSRYSRVGALTLGFLLAFSMLPVPDTAGASSPQLDSISLSFPTAQRGYVLSLFDCAAKTCAALRVTDDASSSWGVVPIPRQLKQSLKLASWGTYNTAYPTLSVHFADASNGWIYGVVPAPVTRTSTNPNWVNCLWSTHDGGETWSEVRLDPRSLGVVQMASHGEWTYLFGASFQVGRALLLATPSNSDRWKSTSSARIELPAGGTQLEGTFTFAGSNGWFVAGNDRGFTASARLLRNGSWGAWSGPTYEKFDASYTPVSAVTNRLLLAEDDTAGFVYPPASTVPPGWNNGATWLFISYDEGATFEPFRELSRAYDATYSSGPGLPAVPVPGTILLQRTTNSGYYLMRSANWGRTWQVVLRRPVSQVVFTSRTTGFAIVQLGSRYSLFRTTDTGSHWVKVNV
jgi:hypothetical protein